MRGASRRATRSTRARPPSRRQRIATSPTSPLSAAPASMLPNTYLRAAGGIELLAT